jgi:hypothetical protein
MQITQLFETTVVDRQSGQEARFVVLPRSGDSWGWKYNPPQNSLRNPVGADGTVGQESDAVPQRGPLSGERGWWEGELLRQARRLEVGATLDPWFRGGTGAQVTLRETFQSLRVSCIVCCAGSRHPFGSEECKGFRFHCRLA